MPSPPTREPAGSRRPARRDVPPTSCALRALSSLLAWSRSRITGTPVACPPDPTPLSQVGYEKPGRRPLSPHPRERCMALPARGAFRRQRPSFGSPTVPQLRRRCPCFDAPSLTSVSRRRFARPPFTPPDNRRSGFFGPDTTCQLLQSTCQRMSTAQGSRTLPTVEALDGPPRVDSMPSAGHGAAHHARKRNARSARCRQAPRVA